MTTTIAEPTDVAITFKSIPWKIHSPDKAEQVARAIEVVFQTRAMTFFGGDAYYVTVAPSRDLENPMADERMKILFWMLEKLDVRPAEDRFMVPLGFDGDNEDEIAEDITVRFEHVLNLADRLDDIDGKLNTLLEDIADVVMTPASASMDVLAGVGEGAL